MCYMNEEFSGSLIDNFCKYEEHFHIGLGIFNMGKKRYIFIISCVYSELVPSFLKVSL